VSDKPENNWSVKGEIIFGLLILVLLFGGFATWATTTQIAGAILASGRIEVDRNRQVVQHEKGGVVAAILVDEGETVAAGDVLIRLAPQALASRLAIVEGQLFELMARRGRLEAQRDETATIQFEDELLELGQANPNLQELMDGQGNLFRVRRASVGQEIDQLAKRHDQITSQIKGSVAQEAAFARQLELIELELTSRQSLYRRGVASVAAVLALQREQARLGGQIGELEASKAQANAGRTEIDIEILRLGTAGREAAITQLRELRYRELELVEKRRALRVEIEQLNIRAPVSGIVYGMQVQTPRSVIRAAEPVMYLVPQDRPLVIAARVSPTNVDEVTLGQQVTLRMSSLNQRTSPELLGRVVQISADAIEGPQVGQSHFRAEITLNSKELKNLADGVVLLPGMPVEVFIRTADRSPMAYFLKPITDYFARAFRES
jgi:HlyD family secretion protein